jgi:hypothetical protein
MVKQLTNGELKAGWLIDVHKTCHRCQADVGTIQGWSNTRSDAYGRLLIDTGLRARHDPHPHSRPIEFNLERFRDRVNALVNRGFHPDAMVLCESALQQVAMHAPPVLDEVRRLYVYAGTNAPKNRSLKKRINELAKLLPANDPKMQVVLSNLRFGDGAFAAGRQHQQWAESMPIQQCSEVEENRIHVSIKTRGAQLLTQTVYADPKGLTRAAEDALAFARQVAFLPESQLVTLAWILRLPEIKASNHDPYLELVGLRPEGPRWSYRADALAAFATSRSEQWMYSDEEGYMALCAAQAIYALLGAHVSGAAFEACANRFIIFPAYQKTKDKNAVVPLSSEEATELRRRVLGISDETSPYGRSLPKTIARFMGQSQRRLRDRILKDFGKIA